jgi:hypothetical protein
MATVAWKCMFSFVSISLVLFSLLTTHARHDWKGGLSIWFNPQVCLSPSQFLAASSHASQPASQPAPLIFFLINQFYKIIITFAAWSTNSWAQVNGRCTCLLTHQDWLTVLGCFFSSLSLKKLSLNSYWPSAYGSLFEVTWYCITIIIIIYIKIP